MPSLSESQIETAQQFVDATAEALGSEGRVHAETAIAGASRMAGTFLFRSFNFQIEDVKPGQPVLSDIANEQGPELMQLLEIILHNMGIMLNEKDLNAASNNPENKPLLDFLETQKRLEPKFTEVKNRFGLSLLEAAQSAVAATAIIIQQTANVLNPSLAFTIAVYGLIEGSKTFPAPIED